jgi:hypothetical protein
MSGQLVGYAESVVTALQDAGLKATADIRSVELPGILVSPVPARDYDILCGGFTATWTVALIAPGPGDLNDARELEKLADEAFPILRDAGLPVETFEVASYVLPGMDPKPAYLVHAQTAVTEEPAP